MPNGTIVNFTYDNRGNVTGMTDGIGTATYGYDSMGQLINVNGPWADDTITPKLLACH